MKRRFAIVLSTFAFVPLVHAQDAADGAALFKQQCGVCHSAVKDDPHRQGPTLWGVAGAKAGMAKDFTYTPAFRKAMRNRTWTDTALDKWITDPQAVAPGTAMAIQLGDPAKRAAIIEYLKAQK